MPDTCDACLAGNHDRCIMDAPERAGAKPLTVCGCWHRRDPGGHVTPIDPDPPGVPPIRDVPELHNTVPAP